MNETLLLKLAEKLSSMGVVPGAYLPLVERGREIMEDTVDLAGRRILVLNGGEDSLSLDQITAELHVCQDRMLELLASIEVQSNADGEKVLRAVLAEVLSVVLKAIV